MKWMRIFFFLFPVLLSALETQEARMGTQVRVTLLNDSPFTLTGVVQAADGTFLGQREYAPGEQNTFVTTLKPTDMQSPGYYDIALTPYIVVWKCPNGGFYSVCTGVAAGALVTANTCPSGPYYCQPKQEKPKPEEKKEPEANQ